MIQLKALLIFWSELSESQLMMRAEETTQGGTRRLWPHPAIIKSSSLSARSVQTLLFPWHIITFHESFSYPTSCNTSKPTNPPSRPSHAWPRGMGLGGGGVAIQIPSLVHAHLSSSFLLLSFCLFSGCFFFIIILPEDKGQLVEFAQLSGHFLTRGRIEVFSK